MRRFIFTTAMLLVASTAMAQHGHRESEILETGQSQFAAIGEIVALLRDDPQTNWEQIDIDALRGHLMDMNNVMVKSAVVTTVSELSVTFTVTGDAIVAASIKRMIVAHSPMLQTATGWRVESEVLTDGATMTIDAESPGELNKITGLGFFGLMTIGAHHRQHHQMIASGQSSH